MADQTKLLKIGDVLLSLTKRGRRWHITCSACRDELWGTYPRCDQATRAAREHVREKHAPQPSQQEARS